MKTNLTQSEIEQLARTCHEAARAFAHEVTLLPQPAWLQTTDDVRHSYRHLVTSFFTQPEKPLSDLHEHWRATKENDGWHYGEDYDPEIKTHPWLRPFAELPENLRTQYGLTRAIVTAWKNGF